MHSSDSREFDGSAAPGICPFCGAKGFGPRARRSRAGAVTLTCADCALICRVLIGPDSPSWEIQMADWAAQFPGD